MFFVTVVFPSGPGSAWVNVITPSALVAIILPLCPFAWLIAATKDVAIPLTPPVSLSNTLFAKSAVEFEV